MTELAETGAGDEVIMSIAGHVSRAMLSRYSHVCIEAKRLALETIAARQRAADEQRREAEDAKRGKREVQTEPARIDAPRPAKRAVRIESISS